MTILNLSLTVAAFLTVVFGAVFGFTAIGKKEIAPRRYSALRAATMILAAITLVLAITDFFSH